ncbi:MAG TPA: AmmeMemoRadiSam system radical SAM enzyme [Candidatus Aenigmarchaeota archaeon]|nr:AmmeMemoRadiSam system radical SAM enzyme [Candidatus Aenigmarchaeota archaeon]
MKEALFYKKLENKKVKCELCPRTCNILPDKTGACRVRKNLDGKLYTMVYAKPCSISVDPIEKKPLFHLFPGSKTLSLATVGCNLFCSFCQNYEISQGEIFGQYYEPKKIVELAERYGVEIISYTYTEPTIFYEYAFEIMRLAKKKKFKNVWVTNGYTNLEPIEKIIPYLDAVNVDIKGSEEIYKELCKGSLKPVLKTLLKYKKSKIWIEITSLIIPSYNDSEKWVNFLTNWIKDYLGKETPLHLSRFFPHYKLLNIEPTPITTLKKLYRIAKENLDYVYIGNIFESEYENTYCSKCKNLVIKRIDYKVEFKNFRCENCGSKIAGIF